MNTKTTIVSVTIAVVLIGWALILAEKNNSAIKKDSNGNIVERVAALEAGKNVSIEDNKQIIVINAKGGYLPRKSVAKAGLPTILRFDTDGTFDCSASVRIPSLGISKLLPQSGSTDIDLGTPGVGKLNGTCGMGMYSFEIDFQGE